jgi:trk system potassium uptake protein
VDIDKHNPKLNLREKIFKWFFLISDSYKIFISWISGLCSFFLIISIALSVLCFLFYIGFNYSPKVSEGLLSAFRLLFTMLFLSRYIPEVLRFKRSTTISLIFRILIFLFTFSVFLANTEMVNHQKIIWGLFYGNTPVLIAIALIGVSEMTGSIRLLSSIRIPPALILSSSFLLIIIIGSGLLLLPKAHTGQLSFTDSLFTAVSAVCVTGLTVVDTAAAFTVLGKIIILCLIQIGGLGIMTFTGFFSYIFTSTGSSFRNRLLLKEIFSAESLNNLFKLLVKIILITFLTEIAGALIIYASLGAQVENKLLVSLFHAVSAFCNAGFSTLSQGLFSPVVRNNNTMHISVSVLIILGGIGFPVLVNLYSFIRHMIITLIRKLQRNRTPLKPYNRNIATRLVLITTGILILSGAGMYYYFESVGSLNGLDNTDKVIASFFGSISARTAGFSMVDISLWSYPTIFLMMMLMWIGASPGSTGGGIKTTTFALALRSAWSNLRGRERLIVGNREIGSNTIARVLSIIFLSLTIIAAGFFSLLLSEPGRNPVHLLFECISAFGTVGLSLAGTGSFSDTGKLILIFLMFTGRVGPLTLFTGFILSYRKRHYRYPELEIIIN